jgi:aspartyl-tRNA(Asn)/glutamyl-tRNA(Gln) amidotransferase subunit B
MVKIGLEIHGYLQTREKLFCRCRAMRHSKKENVKPNTFVCPICCGYPGCKPMLPNAEALKKLVQIALIMNCSINTVEKGKKLVWQRKHYDWPDLPKGYQDTISGAYAIPIGEKGKFENISIREVHLEEDPAAWNPETGCIDYNRSGLPLVEIVTEPDFTTESEVEKWIDTLVLTLSYIKAVDKNAGLKADVNISTTGERVEIKNLTSLESIKKAILYEIERQAKEPIARETRRFDENSGKTVLMRTKEQAEDYRFIPDPDLPVIKILEKEVLELKAKLPETPMQKLDKLVKKFKLDKTEAEVLTKNLEVVEFFESVSEKIDPRFALPWVTIELLRVLNWNKATLDQVDIKPEHFAELLENVQKGKVTELKAKQILNSFVPKSFSIKSQLKEFETITDISEIEKICEQVLEKNPKAVEDYKAGQKEALNYLIGEVMKASKRKADFKTSKAILEKLIK